MAQPDPASETVIETIAKREGVEPHALDTPLYDVLDPDALDSLFRSHVGTRAKRQLRMEFSYRGYTVTVESDDDVRVDIRMRDTDQPRSSAEGTTVD